MTMLRLLLAKDLRRAARNPLPWLINLIVPLAMTALLGLVFGGRSDNAALGRIRFAVVDEDRSPLIEFLHGTANQGQADGHLEPVFMDRDPAMKLINANKISAVLIIRTNFTRDYLTGRAPVKLELIKNPAESINPAVLEELLGSVATGLNAIAQNFHSDFPEWQRVLQGEGDYQQVPLLISHIGEKFKTAKNYIFPPLITYEKEGPADSTGNLGNRGNPSSKSADRHQATTKPSGQSEIFAYLLLGLSAMFLLFLGQNAMTDLHRELRQRTFERYRTMQQELWPFIVSKVLFTVVILLLCSGIMLIGGGLVFGIQWRYPLPMTALVFAYSCVIAAIFAVLVALVPDERRAGVLNNLAGMALGILGGCAFPPRQFPAFLRDHVTPLMPSFWFADTARNLQFNAGPIPWHLALLKLFGCAILLIALAACLFRRRFGSGLAT
jgi:ABC-type multidrug transport system permease subunit